MSEQVRPGRGAVIGCFVGLAVLVAAVVGGVVWFVGSLHGPRHQVAASTSDYDDLCGGRAIPGAAAYTPGPGPHPVAVFGADQDDSGGFGTQVTFTGSTDTALFNPSDVSTVQLVACAERTEDGPQVSTCDYRGASVPVHRSTVEVTLYEARTAEQVGRPITLAADDLHCPIIISYRGEPAVYSTPSAEQFRSALADVVGVA